MQLALSFSTLLATILVLLSTSESSVQAAPLTRRGKSITLPLQRAPQKRGDVHPLVLYQQHINRAHKRLAVMKGREPPSKRDMEEKIRKRLYIPPNGRPGTTVRDKRFNRGGLPSVSEAVSEGVKELGSLVKGNAKANKDATKKTKGKGAAASGTGGNGGNTNSGSSTAAAQVTDSDTPTTANSLALDIEAQDVGYLATIQMGTPPQDFLILMDSGSADLWVGSETCQSEGGGDCGNHKFLGPNGSSSFTDTNKQFQVTYGTGEVAGDIVTDDISVAGLALPAHTFGVANTESVDFSSDSVPFDGLMGLAQSSLSSQGVPTPVDALASAGLISDAIVSYKIPRLADNLKDGEITFGALDSSKFDASTLVTFDVTGSNGFWEGAMDAVTADGQDLGLTGRSAILDTGTTLIVAPPDDATTVHQAIPGAESDGQGGFVIPCDTNTTIALTFGGQSFDIDTRDLIFGQADTTGQLCTSGISSGEVVDDVTWLVGDVFLKNAYFSTDVGNNQISLAKLV